VYEKAIKKNNKLQGVHASYGTHLLKQGDVSGAQKEFALEIENHPLSEKSVGLAMTKQARPDSTSGSAKTR
jgi:Tfp pilus assembly protein PilF